MLKKPNIRKTAAILAAVAVAAVAQVATARSDDTQQDAAGNQILIDQGKTTYAEKCSHCHGPNMVNSGTITPDLRTFPNDKTRFVTTVKQGKNGRMPPWGDLLNDEKIAELWAYISSRRKP
ncbi:cytochrome c [Bradyrhizobium sp.]|uniref:c-type cytochrome n=1 Tax=Bradyrhizobium sp. TaxID=376 RepID=UPI0025C72871|nr:cytochrome c [Bradyrhizobium sp.]